jgi:hypothetical protein
MPLVLLLLRCFGSAKRFTMVGQPLSTIIIKVVTMMGLIVELPSISHRENAK